MDSKFFTESQRSMISKALNALAITIFVVLVAVVLRLVLGFASSLGSVILSPIVAIIFVMIVRPYYEWICRKVGQRRNLAVALFFVSVGIPLCLALYYGSKFVISQFLKLLEAFPTLVHWITDMARQKIPELVNFLQEKGLLDYMENVNLADLFTTDQILKACGFATTGIGGVALLIGSQAWNIISAVLGWFILPIYIALLLPARLLGGDDVKKLLVFCSPKTRDNIGFLVDQFLDIMVAFFRGQVFVAFILGILYGIGFQVVGLPYGFILGFTLGLMNVVPYLGNFIGLCVTLPLAMFCPGGGVLLFVKVIVVFTIIHMCDSFVITPRVMSDRTGLSPFVVIFSLFFWGNIIGGVLGMLLAIPLSAFVVVFWRLLKRDYIQGINPEK